MIKRLHDIYIYIYNKDKLKTGVLIFLIFLILLGATYAYLREINGNNAQVPATVSTNTTDTLAFEVGTDIGITADTKNFNVGMGNQSDTTFAKAVLKANNKTNNVTRNYYVYFEVAKNEFTYSTEEKIPELLLKITNPSGEEVTAGLDGVEYKTVIDGNNQEVSGFDITEFDGLLTIANSREISATKTTEETWNIEVILVNINADQFGIGGKSFVGALKAREDEMPTLATYVKDMYNNIQGTNNIYYHKNLSNSAEDGSYRYAGADYQLTSKASSYNSFYDTSGKDVNGVVKLYCSLGENYSYVGSQCVTYSSSGTNTGTKYYYLAYDTRKTQYNSPGAAFRKALLDGYIKENVNNYVCFGYDDETKAYASGWCPNDNLYRMIGVFGNKVKLIKADFATATQLGTTEASKNTISTSNYIYYKGALTEIPTYYWSGSSTNQVNSWASSTLSTNGLNKKFLGTFDATWQNKIARTEWKTGGNTWENIAKVDVSTAYLNEIVNPVTGQTPVKNKIGLMYVSDYYYGASPDYWTCKGIDTEATDYRAATGSNWMYSGIPEWTISRQSSNANSAFNINNTGYMNYGSVASSIGLRPSFYLTSSVVKKGGTGTSSDPYRIS